MAEYIRALTHEKFSNHHLIAKVFDEYFFHNAEARLNFWHGLCVCVFMKYERGIAKNGLLRAREHISINMSDVAH